MSNLHTLYSIVPINDKCSILCEDVNGTHFAISKGSIHLPIDGKKLIFKTYDAAQDYINYCLNPVVFFVEEFGGNDDIYAMTYLDEAVSLIDGHTD